MLFRVIHRFANLDISTDRDLDQGAALGVLGDFTTVGKCLGAGGGVFTDVFTSGLS